MRATKVDVRHHSHESFGESTARHSFHSHTFSTTFTPVPLECALPVSMLMVISRKIHATRPELIVCSTITDKRFALSACVYLCSSSLIWFYRTLDKHSTHASRSAAIPLMSLKRYTHKLTPHETFTYCSSQCSSLWPQAPYIIGFSPENSHPRPSESHVEAIPLNRPWLSESIRRKW